MISRMVWLYINSTREMASPERDGFTGTNFNHPDFQRMIKDARNRLINTIVVKDLSRFGRNYVQVGTYISEILPELGVRFIAGGDDVDSASGNLDYDLIIPIKDVFNITFLLKFLVFFFSGTADQIIIYQFIFLLSLFHM